MSNKEIVAAFLLLSKLMEIHGENSFKAKAFANAAFAIDKLPFEIEDAGIEAIEGERGIGKSAISSILQLMDEKKLVPLEELKRKTPQGIIDLMAIRGIGPKKIGQLWKELGIESPADLLSACHENKLTSLKGFGAKTQQTILDSLEYYFQSKGSLLWVQADQLIYKLKNMLTELFPKNTFDFFGEYYWQNETVSSFTVIINTPSLSLPTSDWVLQSVAENCYIYEFRKQLTISFICVTETDYALQRFIQSFSDEFRQQLPFSKIAMCQSEEEAFAEIGIPVIPPYLRNCPHVIGKAKANKLPRIITTKDIVGVIHNHSNWSDGVNSIEEMARACMEKGFAYLVMSDHSKTSFYANGLSEARIEQQHEEIDKLNAVLQPFRIYKSIECDILSDGTLDYDDAILSTFDIIIASVHQNLKMPLEKAMNRLLRAIENPYTSILGHPTGRLLLSREGYPIDHRKVIDACAANEVTIEINANPRRLDLDWRWIEYAMEKEVLLSINPDAHTVHGIDDIQFGVRIAQKGLLTPAMNLSSFSKDEFEEYLFHQHQKRG